MALTAPDFTWKDKAALDAAFTASGSPGSTTNNCENTIADLDGVNDVYTFPTHLSFGNSFSLAFTLQIETDSDGTVEGIMNQILGGGGSAGKNQWFMDKESLATGRITLLVYDSGGLNNHAKRFSTFDYDSGTEQRVVFTVAPSDDINHYRNGALENGTLNVVGTGYDVLGGTLQNFEVGRQSPTTGQFGKIQISRIAVWSTKALSAGDITEWDAFEALCANPHFGEVEAATSAKLFLSDSLFKD